MSWLLWTISFALCCHANTGNNYQPLLKPLEQKIPVQNILFISSMLFQHFDLEAHSRTTDFPTRGMWPLQWEHERECARTIEGDRERLCGLQCSSVWSLSEIYQESQWKKNTFLGNNPLLSLEHWPLWLTRAWWPCPIPFHQRSGQCEQKTGTLIRDAQMGRSWWQTVSCPSSLMRPLCLAQSMGI